MAITVADLVEMPHLRLTLVAGAAGVDRTVSWTHVSDLPEPWRWLAGGELLMTNGMSFPADAGEQVGLVERLIEAGASGLAIGDQMYCPPLTDAFVEASDAHRFSVLMVEYPMPFVAISQAVAAANLLEQSDRLVRTERIYRAVQRLVANEEPVSVVRGPLSQVLGCEVHVCHRDSAEPWYPQDPRFDPELSGALRMITSGKADLRAGALVVPLEDGREVRLVDIPTQASSVMVLVSDKSSVLDAILMQHAVTVIALELSQSLVGIEHRRRLGAELLAQLMEGRPDARASRRQLSGFGISVKKASLVAVSSEAITKLRDVHVTLWRHGIAHLLAYRSGLLYLLADGIADLTEVLRADLGEEALIGISSRVGEPDRVAEAVREATWAVRAAAGTLSHTFRYGEASPLLGVDSIDDSAALVARVLGPLIEYERLHDTPLLATLDAYLGNQRSWQKTADALSVHRQTVLYRIRKVEEITGHTVSDTRDIAEFWLALQAHALLAPGTRTARS